MFRLNVPSLDLLSGGGRGRLVCAAVISLRFIRRRSRPDVAADTERAVGARSAHR